MEEAVEMKCWDELVPDVLGLIFSKLTFLEVLIVIPMVCKSWGKAVSGPYCWQEIDIKKWSLQCRRPEHVDRMLRMLITRSSGCLRKLSVSSLSNDSIFSFIADHAGFLQTLRLPRSKISDCIVEQVAEKLSTITYLDVSHCTNIGARSLEAIGKNCKSLVELRRVMKPAEMEHSKLFQDDEAHAIATTMPKLKKLEVSNLLLTTVGVVEILLNCQELEFLDIRGCWYVMLDDKFLKEKCSFGLKVLGPDFIDCHGLVRNVRREVSQREALWEFRRMLQGLMGSAYSDSTAYLAWGLMAV
ncbi:F-box domain [Macleaya cordata]|uniref:F-box domain n=1 Tax=Macleaya cordata TaxID=56857 RepID=A0A200PN60_MACCD|nr:F-box domain [Macleaya cordata]